MPREEFERLPEVTRRALIRLKDETSIKDARFNSADLPAPMRAEVERLIKTGEVTEAPPGRLYEVSLHAKPEEFLDWDLPLSQQSEGVKRAFRSVYGYDPKLERLAPSGFDMTQRKLTDALHESGLKGIRYKDQGSRGKEGGTSNYVVFPGAEDIIEIIGKDGKPLQGAERADAVKKLYARQGMPIPGQEDQQDTPSLKGFGGKVPQDIRRGFGGPIPNRN